MHRPDRWTIHNLFGHVVSEILWLLGCDRLSMKVHDGTLPEHEPGTGRG